MTRTTVQNDDSVYCGYIKAKFATIPGVYLDDHMAYQWCCNITHPRVTENFVYVSLGHEVLTDNDVARAYIRSIHNLKGKITRIDFNIDYLGLLNFDAFYSIHDNDEDPIPSILKSPGGTTVYVGKRSSARMLRVYDKRGEIKTKKKVDIGFDMTRIELELKRNMVSRYIALFMTGKTDVILSDIQRLYGLRGFCDSHKPSKPIENRDKEKSLWAFVLRYKQIIRTAYLADVDEFLDILEVNDDE